MNHVYRLVWNRSLNALVAVAENAGAGGKASSPRQRRAGRVLGARLAPVARAVLLALGLSPAIALALPTGGQVVSGHARISSSGNTLTVTQTSGKAILDWQGFGIASGETVDFDQPGAGSVALNRVLGNNASDIYGHLNATGQVFLVNPNGIYFAPGAQINVAGLVASTLDIGNQDFLDGNYTFSGSSTAAVVNDGTIATPEGGYVAFIGHQVTNDGTLATPGGTAALGAGGTVDLTLAGNRLLSFKVSQAAINALAENGGLIKANGGTVILSAEAKDALLKTVVNNTGVIQAQTVANHNGTIELLGGDSGTTQVSGTLDASAPSTGDGGFIETSGAHLKVADAAKITTKSAKGQDGQWLIDPNDFTIAASGGDVTGSALSAALASGDVTIQTSSTTASCTGVTGCGTGTAGNGDIFVDDTVSWSANTTLTLAAYRDININAAITASGSNGKVALAYGQGTTNGVIGGTTASYNFGLTSTGFAGQINLQPGSNFRTQLGLHATTTVWTVVDSLGASTNATTAPGTMTLQGMAATSSLSGHYVLGANIDASATSSWNSGAGFTPIGNGTTKFTGGFDGLGHTISHLYINRSSVVVGLFGKSSNATIGHVGQVGGSLTGNVDVGGLVGYNSGGTITDVYATGSVTGTNSSSYYYSVGGLVGLNSGTITGSYATTSVTASGSIDVGGLVGGNGGTITDAYATGSVSGGGQVGGLVGSNDSGTITDAYATGSVSGGSNVGGLVGQGVNSGTITDAYATGSVSGGSAVGGLVGNSTTTIKNAYATGSVSGSSAVGGLVGFNSYSTITGAYATGSVSGSSKVGGLVGSNNSSSTITGGYWDTTTDTTVAGKGVGGGSATGVTGLSTAALSASLPTGFASGTWGNGDNQTTPYLKANASLSTVGGHVILGTDSSAAPSYYDVIQSMTQLQNINSTGLAGHYVLGTNLTDSTTTGSGFTPIGNGTTNFTGVFDGLGHTISHLYIDRPSSTTVGLFGEVYGGTVRNIGLVGGSVTGDSFVGELVGSNHGTISNAYATGNVSGGGVRIGGLAGGNGGTITDVYATGSVSATGTLSATGTNTVGGLVGINVGYLSHAYATGSVSGSGTNVGGLVGANYSGTISNAYATGSVSGSSKVGGLVGYNSGGTITGGYWDTTTDTTVAGKGVGSGSATGVTGLSTAALSASLPTGFASGTWGNGDNQTTPYLKANASLSTVGGHVILGSDSSATPSYYDVIQSMTQLQNINSTGLAGHYVLGTNLTDSTTTGSGFTPIGNSTTKFTGVFDGLNHTISHLYINRSGSNYVGLFGDVNGGTIRNIGLVGGSVTGKADVGALIGYILSGTISNAYATDSVSGSNVVGGLVGDNVGGTISDAYATGSVSGANTVGGLVGYNPSGTITDAYATGSVSGSSNIGGLVGYIASGTISNIYATGSVSGTNVVGGLVGDNVGGTVSDAYATGTVNGGSKAGGLVGSNGGTVSHGYWDTTTTGQGTSAGSASSNGLTSAQMQQSSSFTGFDFTNTWVQYDGHTNPLLRSFMTALKVTAGNVSKTYDGTAYSGGLSSPTYSVAGAAGSGHLLGLSTPYSGDVNAGSYSPGLYSDQQGYIIGYSGGTLTITPKALSAAITGHPTKTYDGTAAATLSSSDYTLSGFVSGQGATVTQTAGTYASPNAGSGIGVTATLAGGDYSANSGTLLSNYVLPTAAAGTGTIDPKALSVSGVSATNKVYDGTAADNLDTTGATLTGVIGADNVSLGSGTAAGTFANSNVGSGIAVNAHLTLTGSAAENYTVTAPTGLTANITPKALSAAITAHPTKIYDSTTAATLTPGAYTLSGFVSGQGATVTQASGTYADANIGSGIEVATTLSAADFRADAGTLLSNYILPTRATGTGSILSASVSTSVTTAERAMQGGYALPVSGPSLLLAPISFAQLTQMPGKPSGVEVKASGRGVSPPARPCHASANLDPLAPPHGLCKQ